MWRGARRYFFFFFTPPVTLGLDASLHNVSCHSNNISAVPDWHHPRTPYQLSTHSGWSFSLSCRFWWNGDPLLLFFSPLPAFVWCFLVGWQPWECFSFVHMAHIPRHDCAAPGEEKNGYFWQQTSEVCKTGNKTDLKDTFIKKVTVPRTHICSSCWLNVAWWVYVYLQVQCSSGNNRNISHMRNYLLLGLFSVETSGFGHLLPLVDKV